MRLLLALFLLTASLEARINTADIRRAYSKLYKTTDPTELAWYSFVGYETVRYARALNLKDEHIKILAAAWVAESSLDPRSVAPGEDSFGVTQVRVRFAKEHSKPLVNADIMPEGSLSDPTVQIALGVSAYRVMLDRYKDPWLALQRYNGKGWKSERHLKRTKRIYKRLWGK